MATQNDTDYYLFTFSPKGITLNTTYMYMDHINSYFWSWHKCMEKFEVNPELNSNGNLHYHGYYKVKDRFKWFKKVLPKMKYNGMWRTERIHTDFEKSMIYPRKDRELMEKVIEHKIPFTHEDKIKHIPDNTLLNTIHSYFDPN